MTTTPQKVPLPIGQYELLDDLPELVAFIDTERKHRYVNRAYAGFFGRQPEETLGLSIAEVGGPEHYAVAESYIGRALDGETIAFGCHVRRGDGAMRDVELTYRPRVDHAGIVSGFLVFGRDVTDPAFVAEARARLAAIIDSSDDAIVSKTLNGVITSWNRSAERIFGYSAEEAVGQHITLIIPPERRSEEDEVLSRLRRGEKIDHFETERRAKDGRTVYISLSVSPVRDSTGKIIGAAKVARDITDRKRSEQALRQVEEYRRAVLESMPECVKVLDIKGNVLQMNAAGLRMVEADLPDQVIGHCVYPLIHERDVQEFRELNENVFRGGSGGQLEFSVRGLKGTERIFETNVVPLRGGTDEVIGALSVTRDITTRKQAESRDAFLVRLHDATQALSKPREITDTAARLLAEHLDADRCAYAVVNSEAGTLEVTGDYARSGASIAAKYPIRAFGPEFERRMRAGQTYVVEDVCEEIAADSDLDVYNNLGIRSVIAVPLVKDGRLAAAVAVHHASARRWRDSEIELVQLVANRFWESIERARVEVELRNSEQQFRTLADTIPNLAWMAHADGHIFWYNRRWYEYTGTTPDQMEGWGWQAVHDSSVLPVVKERWQYSIATGEPFEMVFPLKGKNEQFRAFLTRVEPITDRRGRVVRWFGTNTDVTAQEEAQAREKRARETAEVLNRVGPVLAAELNVNNLVQKITDIATEAVRAEFGALFHLVSDPAHQSWTLYAVSGNPPADLAELPTEMSGGSFELPGGGGQLVVPVKSRTGELLGSLVFGHRDPRFFSPEAENIARGIAAQAAIALDNASLFDETRRSAEELRRTNENLRRLNDDLNQFAYSASHDLREPLRMVSIYTQLLGRKVKGHIDQEGEHFLDYVLKGASRLEALIRDLLAYTKAAENADGPSGTADTNEALKGALTNLAAAVEESGARISVASTLPNVAIAEVHLIQILQNLIGNGIKYRSEEVPEIRVGAERRGPVWELFVADNGMGIAEEYKDQIFGIFKRLHNAEEYSGTGIGLAICQRIVQRYGGRIWVESRLGRGSTFRFTLPAAD